MGFLYGVLKDVSEKQPYSVGKETLKNLVSDLINKHLCSGHEGFKRLFDVLPDRIAQYNREVRESNEKVKKPIKKLQDEMKELKNQVSELSVNNGLQDPGLERAVSKAKKLVTFCIDDGQKFCTNIHDAHKYTSDLNNNCEYRVISALRNIKHEGRRLFDFSKNASDDLTYMNARIAETVNNVKLNVNGEIKLQVVSLVSNLNNKVLDIIHQLQKIDKRLIDFVGALKAWIFEVKGIIYSTQQDVTKIIYLANGGPGSKRGEIKNGHKILREKATEIHNAVTGGNAHLVAKVKDTQKAVAALDEALQTDLKTLRNTIYKEIKTYKANLSAIKGLHGNVQHGLWTLRNDIKNIKTNVANVISSANNVVNKELKKLEEAKQKLAAVTGPIKDRSISLAAKHNTRGFKEAYQKFHDALASIKKSTAMGDLNLWVQKIKPEIAKLEHLEKISTSVAISAPVDIQTTVMNLNKQLAKLQGALSHDNSTDIAMAASRIKSLSGNLKRIITQTQDALSVAAKDKGIDDIINAANQLEALNRVVYGDGKSFDDADSGSFAKLIDDLTEAVAGGGQVDGLEGAVNAFENSAKEQIQTAAKTAIDSAVKLFENKGIVDVTKSNFMEQYKEAHRKLTENLDKTDLEQRVNDVVAYDPWYSTVNIGKALTTYGNSEGGRRKDLDDAITFLLKLANGINVDESMAVFSDQYEKLIMNLSELMNDISDIATKGLRTSLDLLKTDTINSKLNSVIEEIRNFRLVKLADVITMATQFASEAETQSRECIRALNTHVNLQLDTAISNMTTQIRGRYICLIQDMLNAFADKITSELKDLPALIDEDRREGFKGFMRTLQGRIDGDGTSEENIQRLKEVADLQTDTGEDKKEAFKKLSENFQKFFWPLTKYLTEEIARVNRDENQKKNPPLSDIQDPYTSRVEKANNAFNALLHCIHKETKFNNNVPGLCDKVTDAIAGLKPDDFSKPNTSTIDCIPSGLEALVTEFRKAYISRYDSQICGELIKDYKQVSSLTGVAEQYDVTAEGRNCTKVCLTTLSILFNELSYFRDMYNNHWKWKQINLEVTSQNGKELINPLGNFFHTRGYKVRKHGDSRDGELRNIQSEEGQKHFHKLKNLLNLNGTGSLKQLHDCLELYYQVKHISTFNAKKRPCNIYEILCWFAGLPCSSAYEEMLGDAVSDLFVDPRKQPTDADEIPITLVTPDPLPAYPNKLSYDHTRKSVINLCSLSYDLLVGILGTGDANTMYAVDFCTNALNMHYPTKPEDCLEMVIELLRRLLPTLQFMSSQCKLGAQHGGWARCGYGKNIPSAKLPCKEHPADESQCQPNCQSMCEPKCQPKSPLMSYLNDCLPGHLPHQLTSIGCKTECSTCKKVTPGMPCLTPLGFRAFSGSTKTGEDLCEVLSKLLDDTHLMSLLCLVPTPPSTLPEHFGFTLSLVNDWHDGSIVAKNCVQNAIETSITKTSIGLYYQPSIMMYTLSDAYGSESGKHRKCKQPHLLHLVATDFCDEHQCAPYLQSMCRYSYYYLAEKHANLYLSWAIYLPWTFWDLLNNLYNAFCSINCQDWGCRGCLRGDKCKKGEHGVVDTDKPSANCQCPSIVDCKGVAPTLYQYGFSFGEASTLNGESPKKCSDFCSQLKNVLDSQYFKNLFTECDNFLWKIREPFSYLVLALWLLSLLYLLHIMVIRLDLLHIKSHLHSPSSHRIAAQSLLAAARVNKLNRVFYLQP